MRTVHAAIFSVAQSFQDTVYVWEEGGSQKSLIFPHTPAASTVTGHHTSNLEIPLCLKTFCAGEKSTGPCS